jgi:hypothetical protein
MPPRHHPARRIERRDGHRKHAARTDRDVQFESLSRNDATLDPGDSRNPIRVARAVGEDRPDPLRVARIVICEAKLFIRSECRSRARAPTRLEVRFSARPTPRSACCAASWQQRLNAGISYAPSGVSEHGALLPARSAMRPDRVSSPRFLASSCGLGAGDARQQLVVSLRPVQQQRAEQKQHPFAADDIDRRSTGHSGRSAGRLRADRAALIAMQDAPS